MKNNDTDFLSVVSHDLKTPISAVKGFIELVEHSGSLNERQQHFMQRAIMGLMRMEKMVTDLLEYTRLEANDELEKLPCDIAGLVDDTLELQGETAAARGITINVTADRQLKPVIGDEHLLNRVVNNLISNAIKYNRDSGHVEIALKDAGECLQLDVRDSGEGIAPADLPHIFDRFFRSKSTDKREGNGLGLTITRMIVERHNGSIEVESEPGRGTLFRVLLPYQPQASC